MSLLLIHSLQQLSSLVQRNVTKVVTGNYHLRAILNDVALKFCDLNHTYQISSIHINDSTTKKKNKRCVLKCNYKMTRLYIYDVFGKPLLIYHAVGKMFTLKYLIFCNFLEQNV